MTSICVLGNAGLGPDAAGAVSLTARLAGPVAMILLTEIPSDSPPESGTPGPSEPAHRLSLPPTLGAARLGSEIRQHGHPARASWRLVTSRVQSADEALAVGELLAGQGVRPVFGVEGPVDSRATALLEGVGVCLIALREATPEGLGVAAAETYEALGVSTQITFLPEAGIATALVAAGIAAPPGWSAPIEACLARLRDV
ncbi:MAG: hypothetical protein WCI34_07350 [Actinomycetes bacterium]